jgi:hypothetical protein
LAPNSFAYGINDAGQIVGTYLSLGHGFLYSGGFYTTLDDPLATSGNLARGINAAGQIVGEYFDGSVGHGFLEITVPNPPPSAGTTADMILRGANSSPAVMGQYEIYDIGSNSILAAYSLGQVGTDWQFAGLGSFFGSDTTDMLLRSASTGAFEVYDISNNNITGAAALGTVGLNWQVAGFADFNQDGMTDMMLRNSSTGGFEVYNIANNSIINAAFVGTVGLNWQVAGFGNFSSLGESDMILRNTSTGGLEVYDIASNQLTNAAFMGTVGLDWQTIAVSNFSSMPGESDMIMRNTKTGGLEVYDIAGNQITGAAFLGTFCGRRPNLRCGRFRLGVAQRNHRRLRSLRYRQQSNHGGRRVGRGRLGLAAWRVRRRSAECVGHIHGYLERSARAGDGGFWRRRRGRNLKHRRARRRCITAAVADDAAARMRAATIDSGYGDPECSPMSGSGYGLPDQRAARWSRHDKPTAGRRPTKCQSISSPRSTTPRPATLALQAASTTRARLSGSFATRATACTATS